MDDESGASGAASNRDSQDRSLKRVGRPEHDLVEHARNGDARAFGELYKIHLDAIFQYVSKRVGHTGEAEDLTQLVFLKAWKSLDRYQTRQVPFRAWLYRIAHNAVVDHFRTTRETVSLNEQAIPVGSSPEHAGLPEDAVISQEQSQERRDLLRRALSALRPPYQQVIALRFLSGLSYSETAEVLGRSIGNVRVMQFRALKALRQQLTKDAAE
jgi:RNA polymerase sigma-70 factor (ECF subfamily)